VPCLLLTQSRQRKSQMWMIWPSVWLEAAMGLSAKRGRERARQCRLQ